MLRKKCTVSTEGLDGDNRMLKEYTFEKMVAGNFLKQSEDYRFFQKAQQH